jgi:release factor glutamine methyltransferase
MRTVGEVLRLSFDYLRTKDPSFLRRDVEWLITSVLGCQRLDLYLASDRPLQENELDKIRQGVKRLAAHEPIQYVQGMVDFFDCIIHVDRRVLIPRPETELLVEKIAAQLAQRDVVGKRFVDLCCGSGCIGIAIKKKFPELEVLLLDVSREALAVAEKNARHNQVEVQLLEGDLLSPMRGAKTHFLACNPPYLSHAEYEIIDNSVRCYEPKQALVAGNSGLELYERLAQEAKVVVIESIWLEIGASQGSHVVALFKDAGYGVPVLEKDCADRDRFVYMTV